ncbi:MAG TPA: PAS domain S-box protein, partial [Rhodocyclaceae bacterium]|nr:PAS domain S-box protein [Rhodocyclaceae bacterium]
RGRVVRVEGAFHDLTELLARSRRLAESEATLNAVFSQSYMYQGVLDAEGRLAMANDMAFDACGYRAEEEVGRLFWECGWWNADPALMEQVRGIVERAFAGETVSIELDYFVASGERRRTQFAAVPIRVNGDHERRVLVSGMDVTGIRRNEAFHIRLRQVLEQIAARRPLADSLLSILILIETLFPRKRASINLLSADGLRLAHGYSPHLPPDYMRLLEGLAIGPRAGSCGTAAYERRTIIVEDIASDPLWEDYRELAAGHGLRSCWSLPIFNVQGRVLGTFAIYDTEPAAPQPGELELVADCAHIAGIAIERAQAEAQLHLLDSCIARLNDVLMITEAEPLAEPGPRMLFVNEAFTRLTGYTAAEVLGKTPRILQGPNTQRAELERIRTALKERQPVRAELLNYRKNGEEYWVEVEIVPIPDADGTVRHLAAIERDISERKQAELQLQRSEQRFQYIARATSDTIWDWDLQSNTIWWSEGLVRLFGYVSEKADPSADAWIERIHPDDRARIEAGIHNFIAHGSEDDTWSEEYRFRRADGSYAIVCDRGFVIRAADGSGLRMVGGMLDMSAQRAAEPE